MSKLLKIGLRIDLDNCNRKSNYYRNYSVITKRKFNTLKPKKVKLWNLTPNLGIVYFKSKS